MTGRRLVSWYVGILVVLVAAYGQSPDQAAAEREGVFQSPVFLPVVAQGWGGMAPTGAGVAGCPWTEAEWDALGVEWCYWWNPDCQGRSWCVPMLRARYGFDVEQAMRSCGGPCGAVLFLNEPGLWMQDDCDVDCQVRFLHTYYPLVKAENPNALIIFGNFWRPDVRLVDQVVARWETTYPQEAFPEVVWGVHHYVGVGYEPEAWRQVLGDFCAYVGGQCALTEWGALLNEDVWYRVIADQVPWLEGQGIAHAPFLWWRSEEGYLCTMWADGGLTGCGEAYREALAGD